MKISKAQGGAAGGVSAKNALGKNDTLHLIGVYFKTTLKSWFQYRVDAVLRSLAVFLREATGIIVIYFTLLKFGSLNGWNIYELLFLYSLLFQIIFVNADWFAVIGHGGLGIVLFVLSAGRVGIHWTVGTVVYYLLAVAGGVLIQGAIFLLFAALNIYLLDTSSLKELFYWNMRKFAGYPISIFHKAALYLVSYCFWRFSLRFYKSSGN